MTADSIRLLVVDDQELMRRGMRMMLDAEPDLQVVGEASSGQEAIDVTARVDPHVVLMDVRMPGMDGIDATRRIIAASPDVRVLILTTFDLDEYAFGGLRAGASGFLLKNAPPHELMAAIRAVAAGDALVSPRVTRAMLDLFASRLPRGTASTPSRLGDLTERELEIFGAIAEGLNNAELARRFFVTESTVKTHVGRILYKLDLRDRVQAVILAHELGMA